MYKLLIVDDDVIIRRGLTQNILWEENGFQLIGSAPDGEIALDMIEIERPQIIITDIKMPFVNGLELTKAVKTKYPEIKVILLSGYEEFNYAKEALKLKAFDYVLKPVDNNLLLETAKRAVWEFENERKVQNQITDSIPLLRHSFLLDLISGKYKDREMMPKIDVLNIPLLNNKCIAVLVNADDYYNTNYNLKVMEKGLLKSSISGICKEIIQSIMNSILVDLGGNKLVLIFTSLDLGEEDFLARVLGVAGEMREKLEMHLKTTVTIGVGLVYSKLEDIFKSYSEACMAIKFRHLLGKNQVIYIGDVGFPIKKSSFNFEINEIEMIQKVKLGLTKEALELLAGIEKVMLAEKFISLDSIRLIGVEISILLYKEVDGWRGFSEQAKENINFYEFNNEVQNLETIQDIFNKLCVLITEICTYINGRRETHQNSIVMKATQFMESNFVKEGLSLQEVANNVHVSATYLSIIFKKEKNINFCDFLLDIRMKKAMELIRNKDLMIYEVAEKVGYINAQYFSACFKKYTTFSPSEYKNH